MPNIATPLIRWQAQHGRHHLPWQRTCDPYAIWLSEIMLQQTQVITVIPYYHRFIKRFPNIKRLALASQDDVLACWSGLGYYSRARNLFLSAQIIMRDYQGKFPQQVALIQQLPGIGRSTAAAIAVFAYGQYTAILDGNVKRVFTRYFGIAGYPGKTNIQKKLWQKADACLPKKNTNQSIEAYTQALMDLGSIVCTRSKPDCVSCPLQHSCIAYRDNLTDKLPSPKPRKQLPEKETIFLMLIKHNKILLEKRPNTGIWGGLWCPLEIPASENSITYCQQNYGLIVRPIGDIPSMNHTFTHFKLKIHPHLLHVVSPVDTLEQQGKWITLDDALISAIPAPVKKLFKQSLLTDLVNANA